MSSALYVLLLFSALWTLSLCGTRHFHLVNEQKNWTEAQSYCREKFTDLATTESQQEMDALLALLKGTTSNFWIGLKQKDFPRDNTSWIWSDGSTSSYRYWKTGEPNYGDWEMCVHVSPESQTHRWNDAGCQGTKPFICYTINYASTANVWVGLRHTCTLSFWFWVSGESMCYQNWAQRNGTGVEDCRGGERTGAVQSGSKRWVSLPETQTLNFICSVEVMSSALYVLLLFSALWTLSLCGTRHFHLVNKQKNWTEAQSYCREKFTDLATIESQQEMDALIAVLIGTGGHAWIGLREKDEPYRTVGNRSWTWSDGSNSSYRYWNTGDPNNAVGDNCVELCYGPEYRWNDAGCKFLNPFICYEEAVPLILINQNKTWREALWYCRENHVDLVSIHNVTIQQWVNEAVNYASTANVWVGLRHTCAQSIWFWVSGWSICYQNWAPGNGTGVEDCSGGERTGAVQSGSKHCGVSLPAEDSDPQLHLQLTGGQGWDHTSDWLCRRDGDPDWVQHRDGDPDWVRRDGHPNWVRHRDKNPDWVRRRDRDSDWVYCRDRDSDWVRRRDKDPDWLRRRDRALTGSAAETETLTGSIAKTETLTGSVAETETLTGSVAETETLTGSVAETETLTGSVAETETLTGSVAETETLTGSVAETETLTGSVAETETLTGLWGEEYRVMKAWMFMSPALYVLLMFSALWTLSLCGTRHFHLVNEQKTWTEAQSYCREKFTDLATIESQQEMNAVKAAFNRKTGFLPPGQSSILSFKFWIGLKQKDDKGNTGEQDSSQMQSGEEEDTGPESCVWSDGSNFSYSNWDTVEPNNVGTDNCVEILSAKEYRWNNASCQHKNPFICYEAVNYASTANVWVGLRHTCTLSFWFWVSGESMCYQNWAPGNGTGVEDCSGGERTGAVQSGSKQWVSLPETQTLNFICSVE
ncbi:hypothetical protein NFI96_024315, partial [Prochilodus magdalenae]